MIPTAAEDLPRVVSAHEPPPLSSRHEHRISGDSPAIMKRRNATRALAEPTTSKRRRTYSARLIPESMQIFKGLIFFFFPNNDIAAPRRLRIQRAQEYGATWGRLWGENVTHVIVDKGLMFQDLLAHLKLEILPSTVTVVDECYLSECIKFKSILSPTQMRFRVSGPPLSVVDKQLSTEGRCADSLLLKLSRKQQGCTPTADSDMSTEKDHKSKSADRRIDQEIRGIGECDALNDMIDGVKATKDLPLDSLDELYECDSDTSQSEVEGRKKRTRIHCSTVIDPWQRFACMQRLDRDADSDNPNYRTIEILQKMQDYYARTSDQWRTLAYRKAISALRKEPRKIMTKAQALAIPGIGDRLAEKVEEIVLTDRLRRLENATGTPEDLVFQEFLGIYGAGALHVSRWISQGYRSLEDLETKAPLSSAQRIGVEHYNDFRQRIPRPEVESHGRIVRQAVQNADADMQVIGCGSYRRGAQDSRDVDLIITKPDGAVKQIRAMMMEVVIPQLFKQNFLQASLSCSSQGGGSKWHGACMLPGSTVWRRIDLLFVPGSEIGAALIYFTGDDIFNRSIRLLANKKGMCLNQRGLYTDILRSEGRVKLNTGRLLEGRDERRIFKLLGVPWRQPEDRIC